MWHIDWSFSYDTKIECSCKVLIPWKIKSSERFTQESLSGTASTVQNTFESASWYMPIKCSLVHKSLSCLLPLLFTKFLDPA